MTRIGQTFATSSITVNALTVLKLPNLFLRLHNMKPPIFIVGLFVFLARLSVSQQADPPSVNAFLEIARDPSASAAQKKTIAAVMRSAHANIAEEAHEKVSAGDALVLYGGDPDWI